MAARIREASERWPQRLLVVHVGSAHLLGNGNLVGRVGEPGPVIGAKFSTQLAREARALGTPRSELPSTGLVRTSTGVTFFVGPAGSR